MKDSQEKCGIISITGFPNSGKSTLINNLTNSKVSIISPKAQTTRIAIKGVLNIDKSQIIFIDTPGILKPKSFLDKNMTRAIHRTFDESDINLVMYDARKKMNSFEEKTLINLLSKHKKNILLINKIDLVQKYKLLEISKDINKIIRFEDTYMISALKKKGFNDLIESIKKKIPKKNWIYKKEIISDQKLDFMLSEITREKIFQLLNQELPYSVRIESKIIKKKTLYKVFQYIFVTKKSQKPILIGKNGEKIKEIGSRARIDMEKKLKSKVFLDILVSQERSK